MIRSDEIDQLASALCAAQSEFTAIPKDSTNPFFKSRYAGLPQVVEVASPILTKHGLSISQFIGADGAGDTLTTWLLHKSGQFIAEAMRLHLVDSKGNPKVDPQGQGSATTYARRYAYMAVLGLVADEDDDGNHASQRKQTNGQARVVTAQDVASLTAAAKGLKAAQIKLAFSAVGLDAPVVDEKVFTRVPQAKAAPLAQALSKIERES